MTWIRGGHPPWVARPSVSLSSSGSNTGPQRRLGSSRGPRIVLDLTDLEAACLLTGAQGDVVGEGGSLPGWTAAETAAYWRAVRKLAAAREAARRLPADGPQGTPGPARRRPKVRHLSKPDTPAQGNPTPVMSGSELSQSAAEAAVDARRQSMLLIAIGLQALIGSFDSITFAVPIAGKAE